MGDSDDDVDYKRRDKFRSERRGYDGGGSPPGMVNVINWFFVSNFYEIFRWWTT